MKNILLIISFMTLTACAKNSSGSDSSVATVPAPAPTINNNNTFAPPQGAQPPQQGGRPQPYPYGYDYSEGHCSTGRHRYANLAQYCEALRHEGRNNRCAIQARYNDFRQNCTGRRWQR